MAEAIKTRGEAAATGRAAWVHLDSWAGRTRYRVTVLDETPKRFQVRWEGDAVFRWSRGKVYAVPKTAVTFDEPSAEVDETSRRSMNDEDQRDRMTELAKTFPCLRGARGVDPFEPEELNRWAAGPASHGEQVTASFILNVWDGSTEWEAGKFDVLDALRIWPPSHVEPFLQWARDPWWP